MNDQKRDAHGKLLLVARWLCLPTLALAGLTLLLGLGAVLGGARHASDSAVSSALFSVFLASILAAGLPMLVFVRDCGAGSLSRWLHALGGLSMLLSLTLTTGAIWKSVGAVELHRWRIERVMRHLSLEKANASVIRHGDTVVGVRLETEFALAQDVALDSVGANVAQAMRNVNLRTMDVSVRYAPSAFYYHAPDPVTHEGKPIGGVQLGRGRYVASQVLWLAGLRRLDGDEAPCKHDTLLTSETVRQALHETRSARWMVATSVPVPSGAFFARANSLLWHADVPVRFEIDGDSWLAGYESLALPTCAERQAAKDAMHLQKRMGDFFAGRLSAQQSAGIMVDILCANDDVPLRSLLDRGVPDIPLYAAAVRCAADKRRPEIFSLLGAHLVAHPDDAKMHCHQLEGLHEAHASEKLKEFARAGLPVNCDGPNGPSWRHGLKTIHSPHHHTAEEVQGDAHWIRMLVAAKVPVCETPPGKLTALQQAVLSGAVETIDAWLDAGCDTSARPPVSVATSRKDLGKYSARLLWQLRRHPSNRARNWYRLSLDPNVNDRVTQRMGLPDKTELNTPFPGLGGMVPLHELYADVLASPRLLRMLVDRGARLDAAGGVPLSDDDTTRPGATVPSRSWFLPGYFASAATGVDVVAALDVLTDAEMKTLLRPVDIATGKAGLLMPRFEAQATAADLGQYLCRRRLRTCATQS